MPRRITTDEVLSKVRKEPITFQGIIAALNEGQSSKRQFEDISSTIPVVTRLHRLLNRGLIERGDQGCGYRRTT